MDDYLDGIFGLLAASRCRRKDAASLQRRSVHRGTRNRGSFADGPRCLPDDREKPTGTGTGLFLYDTDAETWEALTVDATTIGDVAADGDGRVVFVDFLSDAVPESIDTRVDRSVPAAYAIRVVDAYGAQNTIVEPDGQSPATAVAIDVDSTGAVYVSTSSETSVVASDGSRTHLGTHSAMPVLAVSPAGDVLAPATRDAGANVEWALTRGSSEARDVMA